MEKNKTQVIVVGGGPAGISCAVTIAGAGRDVILIERGKYCGSKNVFGGAIYAQPTREIFPDFEKYAPIERQNIEHKYVLLGKEDSTVISYKNKKDFPESYSVIRGKFDRWMADQARKAGVTVVEETVVRELIMKDDSVIGVKTELEEYYSDIVILADGVNSLLAIQAGLRSKLEKEDVALSVKEVIKLPIEKINERFHVNDTEGSIYEIFGGPMLGMAGLGFMYTNKTSVTIGLGVTLSDLVKKSLRPYDLLEELKNHPQIAPLIQDGELMEYCAHLIPEGGYNKIPQLYGNGIMICGDSAGLVNNMHWEGTNLAMISGKFAGETALKALLKQDFSKETLSLYKEKLDNSFIMKDLKTYRNLMSTLEKRAESFLGYYPQKINSFFKMFTSVDSIPKRQKYHSFIKGFFTGRKLSEPLKDFISAVKLLWSILIK